MAREAWLKGKLEGFSPVLMPAAHALAQAIVDLENAARDLSREQLLTQPHGAASVAFHLRHIAGSVDRLMTYARGEALDQEQFARLRAENAPDTNASAADLVKQAADEIEKALAEMKAAPEEILFDARYVGRERLETNVFGLFFHVAEHTARHTGQVVTTAKIVKNK